MIQRFLNFFRSGKSSRELDSLDTSDPFKELPHPGNEALFTRLKPLLGHHFGSYPAHPELSDRFFALAPPQKTIQSYVYGYPVMANSEGLVFSWAYGGWSIMIKLQARHQAAARKDKGRINSEYGKDWIEFPAWGGQPATAQEPAALEKSKSEWTNRLRYWMQLSCEDSLASKE